MAEHFTGGTVKGTGGTAMTKATQLEPGLSHGNDESNTSQNPQEDKDQEEYATYELFAICNHSGVYDSGHYVAYIKPSSSCKWYCFNDAFVHKICFILVMFPIYFKGENADEDEQCKGQTGMRKFSPIRNGGNNHDFGQSNPPSDQNTEDSSEDIDIVMKEENGAGGAMEKMRCGLMANEILLQNTDGKGVGNTDADEKWNEPKRMRKNSGTGNKVNNRGIRQGNPSSDPHTEHSPESSDAVMKGKQGTMKNIGMICELQEKEKQIEETDWKEGM
ncbi:hypothetical protein chiPu_0014766 [Chiloscyllium punctatum]|uniref:ubiquitinyl hydrolase 1 n=1 Tax=Chiloscyllium punctatum TaxID=137246 RepID=A0A401T0U7_CHIPU|nr:hypothetical protein [Chiloscyllium punctatum]